MGRREWDTAGRGVCGFESEVVDAVMRWMEIRLVHFVSRGGFSDGMLMGSLIAVSTL